MDTKQLLNHTKYRADIDGLRAIAVLAVVFYHAFPDSIRGGFIGVDIFFVISGYLISTIIFSNLDNDNFSFLNFYGRRIKRIYPALLIVLIACMIFGWFALLADEYTQLGKHVLGGAIFISNFLLWQESGYFDNAVVTKPLLHLWSLGVEEQFYIFWPVILFVAYKKKVSRFKLIIFMLVVSFLLNITIKGTHATANFYSPVTRFWELLIGAVLAYISLNKNDVALSDFFSNIKFLNKYLTPRFLNKIYKYQSIYGFMFIVGGFFLISKDNSFPGYWALLPTCGAALIINSDHQTWFNRFILSNKILVWFGLISFPLYLWHWPIFSFLHIVESEMPSSEVRFIAITSSILLAWLTYKLIERPLRFNSNQIVIPFLFSFMLFVGIAGFVIYKSEGVTDREVATKLAQKYIDLLPYKTVTCYDENYSKTRWPYYTNGLCNQTQLGHKIDYIVWGDSHAEHFFSGLKNNSVNNFLLIGRTSCPPLVQLKLKTGKYFNDEHCEMVNNKSLEYMAQVSNVRVVILSSLATFYFEPIGFAAGHKSINYSDEFDYAEKHHLPNRVEIFQEGLKASVKSILASGKKVVIVKDVPEFPVSPKACIGRPFQIKEKNCELAISDYNKRTVNYNMILNDIKSMSSDIYIFDAAAIFCDNISCKPDDKTHVYFREDGHHLTMAGSEKASKVLVSFLENTFDLKRKANK